MNKQIIALTHSSALTTVSCTISEYVIVAGTGFGHPIFSYLSMGGILSVMVICPGGRVEYYIWDTFFLVVRSLKPCYEGVSTHFQPSFQ